MCVCLWVFSHGWRGPQSTLEEKLRIPWSWRCDLLSMGTGNQTLILWMSSKHYYLMSHLNSPQQRLLLGFRYSFKMFFIPIIEYRLIANTSILASKTLTHDPNHISLSLSVSAIFSANGAFQFRPPTVSWHCHVPLHLLGKLPSQFGWDGRFSWHTGLPKLKWRKSQASGFECCIPT